MYLVNESSELEPVNRDYKIREKSQSLLDHPRKEIDGLSVTPGKVYALLTDHLEHAHEKWFQVKPPTHTYTP